MIKTTIRERISSRPVLVTLMAVLFSTAASGVFAQTKIGVIEVEQILQESKAGKVVIAELEKLQTARRDQLLAKQQEIEALQKQVAEGRLTLAEDRLAAMQKQLEDLTIDIRRTRDDAERELQKAQQERFQVIERSVLPIINSVGKELGYTVIFNKYQSGLLYADETVDLTQMVIERFDATAGQ